MRPGDDFDALYFILRGTVYVSLDNEMRYCFRKHSPGSYFGDFCLMNLISNVFIINSSKKLLFLLKISKQELEELTFHFPIDREILMDRMMIRRNFMNNLTKEFQALELKENVFENLVLKAAANLGPILKTPYSKKRLKELRSGFNEADEDNDLENRIELGSEIIKIDIRKGRKLKTRSILPKKNKKSERAALIDRKAKTERREQEEMISVFIRAPEEDGNYYFLVNPEEKMLGVVPSKPQIGFMHEEQDDAEDQENNNFQTLNKSLIFPEFSEDIDHEFFDDHENMIEKLGEKLDSSKLKFVQMMNSVTLDLQLLQVTMKRVIPNRGIVRKSFKEK